MAFFAKKPVMITCLFVISILHGLIFATAQEVTLFLSQSMDAALDGHRGILSLSLYFSGVAVPLLNQRWCRLWGIKRVFISGLCANFVGMGFFLLTNFFTAASFFSYFLIVLGMLSLGAAISSVATILATYVVVQFPKIVALGLILFYSALNFGFQLSHPLFTYFSEAGIESAYLVGLALLMVAFVVIIRLYFVAPKIPGHLDEFRKGTQIWKELHYRFGLFIIAMVFYGMIENTFTAFGHRYLEGFISIGVANSTLFFFWLALNLGQITIGIPAFWILPSKVLKILPLFIITALALIPFQTEASDFLMAFTIGGLGCSAIFPLLIAMIALDVKSLVQRDAYESMIPYMEAGCGYMVASYTLGLGIIALQAELIDRFAPNVLVINFQVGIAYAVALIVLVYYLARTSPQKAI